MEHLTAIKVGNLAHGARRTAHGARRTAHGARRTAHSASSHRRMVVVLRADNRGDSGVRG